MRWLWPVLIILPVAGLAADGDPEVYKGRLVAEVINEFRDAGIPFAYSTNLVGSDLVVTVEPGGADPVAIVREILRPHQLMIKEDSGIYLIVRFNADGLAHGKILLVVTAADGGTEPQNVDVYIEPPLAPSGLPAPGVFSFAEVPANRYLIDVAASGFESVRRVIDVWPGAAEVISIGLKPAKPEIETISVSASRYEIASDVAASRFVLDQRTIQNMPDVGEDPIRVTQRLPGAAASGASARTHFRGGEQGEIGIMLNGLQLFDPFHVRDYQSIFSAIDARAIEGVEVYTGGFPVRFGDRMSGLVLMESLELLEPRHTEIGISVFNSSLLTAGSSTNDRWLFSARRGNLDLVINPDLGQPRYYDVFAQWEHDFSANATLSINALFADDSVRVVTETDVEEFEQVVSDTRNAQLWVQLENRWSDELTSKLVLSATSFNNTRDGFLGDEEKIVGSVLDHREVEQFTFRQDWAWTRSDKHLIQWGIEAGYAEAEYDYRNDAEYFGLQALYEDQPESISNALVAEPNGGSYAVYFADRWRLAPRTVLEWGLRWDDQTYTDLESDSQLSPRLSVMHAIGQNTELRVSWGRYHQSQAINELQIEDGVTNFWPAQRADHYIAGIRHLFRNKYSVRLEVFYKDMVDVRPRFENLYDPLGLIPEVQPDRIRLEPTGAKSRGVELSIDYSSGPMTWWASYAWSKATDEINGSDQKRSWDQPHAFQGGVSWSNEKWDVAVASSVHTGWPATNLVVVEDGVDDEGEPEFVAIPGPRNVLRQASFASIDFRVSRKWKLRRGTFTAFIEVANVTNRRNECCFDWDLEEDEETGEEVLEKSLDYWLPIMPAVGVLWEF